MVYTYTYILCTKTSEMDKTILVEPVEYQKRTRGLVNFSYRASVWDCGPVAREFESGFESCFLMNLVMKLFVSSFPHVQKLNHQHY
jgi:hypothetical protein